MAGDRDPAPLDIGTTLKQTRRRLGIEIREVEERTKIRTKYLRALENEEWDLLPAPAYVRAFLRSYAELLGLDGEVLADEYRRRFEEREAGPSPAAENVLHETRRQPRETPGVFAGRRGPVLVAIGVGIVLLLVILSLVGGGDDADPEADRAAAPAPGGDQAGGRAVSLTIVAETDVEVCALDRAGRPLLDAQLLTAGSEEDLGRSRRFELDLGGGSVDLVVDGESNPVEATEPTSLRVSGRGVREIPYTGPACP